MRTACISVVCVFKTKEAETQKHWWIFKECQLKVSSTHAGADITIVGAELFKKIAAVAHLKKSQFKPPDKTPYSYDRKPFNLHGKLELDITFEGQTMLTPVYVKMDAQDSLLLSEGVCRQLGIVSYHSQVQQKRTVSNSSNGKIVKLIQTVRLPPQKISVVAVQLEKGEDFSQMVVEPSPEFRNDEDISFGESLVKITAEEDVLSSQSLIQQAHL